MQRLVVAAAVGGLACVFAQAVLTRLVRRLQLLGCAANPLVSLAEPARPPLPISTPEAVGVSSARLQQLSAWSDGWVEAGKIPGMLTMMMRKGKLIYLHSSGHANVDTGEPMNERTLLRFYSMTKPVVSVCAMVAYERGLFQLDEPISIHLPGFAKPRVVLPGGGTEPASREITFRDLLTHTAGLAYGDSEHAVDDAYRDAGCGWDAPYKLTLEEFVERIGALPLAYQPGASWRYSYATDVLGRLLEVVTGLPLDALLAQEVFGPLGMVDSGFHVADDKLGRFAALYEVDEEEADAAAAAASEDRRRFERHHTNAAAAAAAAAAATAAAATAASTASASASVAVAAEGAWLLRHGRHGGRRGVASREGSNLAAQLGRQGSPQRRRATKGVVVVVACAARGIVALVVVVLAALATLLLRLLLRL